MKKYTTPVLFIDGTVDKMAVCEIETEDDGTPLKVTIIRSTGLEGNANFGFAVDDNPWISVNDRLPELAPTFNTLSINVEVKFIDGIIQKDWYVVVDEDSDDYKAWSCSYRHPEDRRDVTHWRYIKE